MKRVFADTSYWIAVVNPRDQVHAKAVRVTRRLSPMMVVTTEMVLVELLNSFSNHGALRKVVGTMVQKLRESSGVSVVAQTPAQFERALSRYRNTGDKSWSLTDCASFELMEAEGIEAALTHDRHFTQAGFRALLR